MQQLLVRSCEPWAQDGEHATYRVASGSLGDTIRTATMLLLVVMLVTAAPLALAEDATSDAGPGSPTCVDVNPESPNPVYVYECPDASGG